MDTVLIYTLPGSQRKLSLRFLAWYLLHQDIQTNSHDSIEDAHFALLLCKLWMDYSSESEEAFEMVMEDIFAEGKKLAFKPPNSAGNTMAEQQSSPRSFTPLSSDQTVAHAVVKSGMATPPPPTKLGLPQWASQNSPSPLRR